jgi:hypothetical protein
MSNTPTSVHLLLAYLDKQVPLDLLSVKLLVQFLPDR